MTRLTIPILFVLVGSATAQNAGTETFSEVYSFKGGADGTAPESTVYVDETGTIYGTTFAGGSYDLGTAFKVDASGVETVLYSFSGAEDGGAPYSNLIPDAAGNLYGTTSQGGNLRGACKSARGCGVVFRIDVNGNETPLHTFAGPDGNRPTTNLVWGGQGNLYGTTVYGGTFGQGVVFEMDLSGNERVLYSFGGTPDDGERPGQIVFQRDNRENLLGTTMSSGNSENGTVFRVTLGGAETVLYRLMGGADGAMPNSGVTQGTDMLYGATVSGGSHSVGVAFSLDRQGKENILYTFASTGGYAPIGTLLRDKGGNLYGVASRGGVHGDGTIFRIDPAGNETVLYNFPYPTQPLAGLFARKASDGNYELYGTTFRGGIHGAGQVYKLTLSPGADFDVVEDPAQQAMRKSK